MLATVIEKLELEHKEKIMVFLEFLIYLEEREMFCFIVPRTMYKFGVFGWAFGYGLLLEAVFFLSSSFSVTQIRTCF